MPSNTARCVFFRDKPYYRRIPTCRCDQLDALEWWDSVRDIEKYCDEFDRHIASLKSGLKRDISLDIKTYIEQLSHELEGVEKFYTRLEAKHIAIREGKKKGQRKGLTEDESWLAQSVAQPFNAGFPVDVVDALTAYPRAILLGEPGAGKSTTVSFHALQLLKNWSHGDQIPLLASLSEYTDIGLKGLVLKRLPGINWSDLDEYLQKGVINFYFDALNVCPVTLQDALLGNWRDGN